MISIADTGFGMSEEELHRLFKLDETFSKSGTSGEQGTGLGLLLSHDFIVKNGGKIWAESIIGLGTTFYFTLKKPVNSVIEL